MPRSNILVLLPSILALLVALAAAIAMVLYLRYNPTPTVYAVVFVGAMMVAAATAAVAPWRSLRSALLAFVAAACFLFGGLTPSWFGFVLLGLASLAIVAVFGQLLRLATETEFWAAFGGGLMGAVFFAVLGPLLDKLLSPVK